MDEIAHARVTYTHGALDEEIAGDDPFALFGRWLADALADATIVEPNAMTVATVGSDGRPSARIVLLRGWDHRGFAFYTNYTSRKGRELESGGYAALLFWWGALQRQIRIEGRAERVTPEESDAYFATRPRGHRISAWASPQSAPVASAAALSALVAAQAERFADADVPRPPHWGGYRVVPDRIEFWQGRPNRLHDRIAFARAGDAWTRERLAP